MMGLAVIEVAPALHFCASAMLPIPPGTCSIRVEPVLSDADFDAGQDIEVTLTLYADAQTIIERAAARLHTGPRGNGHPPSATLNKRNRSGDLTPFPAAFLIAAIYCRGIEIGLRVSFAASPDLLPPHIRAARTTT